MPITGPTKDALLKLLLECFPQEDDFQMLLGLKMQINLDHIVGEGGLRATVYKLIEWLEARGHLVTFLVCAKQERLQRPDFIKIADLAIAELTPIVTLTESLRKLDPGDLAPLANRLLDAADGIGYVDTYKQVHDALHNMEPIRARFSDGIVGPEEMDVQLADLMKNQGVIRNMCDRASPRKQDLLKIADKVDELYDGLSSMSTAEDPAGGREWHNKMRYFLAWAPQSVNTCLVEAIAQLDLGQLCESFDQILRPKDLGESTASLITALHRMRDAVQGRKDQHNEWQRLIDMAHRMGDSMGTSSEELRDFLPFLAADIRALCQSEPPGRAIRRPTAAEVVAALDQFEQAVPLGGRELRTAFNHFHQRAAMRFFFVDRALLEDCNDLKGVEREFRRLAAG